MPGASARGPVARSVRVLGLDGTYNATRKFFDVTATGTLFRYSWDAESLRLRAVGELGYRRYDNGVGAGLSA